MKRGYCLSLTSNWLHGGASSARVTGSSSSSDDNTNLPFGSICYNFQDLRVISDSQLCTLSNEGSSNLFVGCMNLFLSWGVAGLRSSVYLTPEPERSTSSVQKHLLPEAPGWTILRGCSVEHVHHILCCPAWPKGYCVGNVLLDLLEGFFLFRATLEIKVFWT